MGVNVVPAFVVFHTPPDAVARYHTRGSLGSTARSTMRPEIMAGPIGRSSRPAKVFSPYFDSFFESLFDSPFDSPDFVSVLAAFLSELAAFVSVAAMRGRVRVKRANRIVVNRSFISDLSEMVSWSGLPLGRAAAVAMLNRMLVR